MCGIVGVVAKSFNGLIKQHEDSFFEMLYADALRGFDSTGVVGVENDTTFRIAKEASSAEWFIHQLKVAPKKDIEIILPTYNRGKMWIGHNRKKTFGEIKDETAHPFVIDSTFAMVHNGTLHQHEQLAKGCAVDSEALAIHLKAAFDEIGTDTTKTKEVLNEALGKVNGAYAVVIYDQKHHKAHFLRNEQRPLYLIEVDNAWYFMSEPLMGAWVLCRNNYKYESLKCEAVQVHELVTINLENNKVTKEQLSPKKYTAPSRGWGPSQSTTTTPSGTTKTPTIRTNATAGSKTDLRFMTQQKDFKRFCKSWIGSRIAFFPDDFLEKNFPKSIDEDGETDVVIMGGHEDIGWAHAVLAEVDLGKLKIRWSEDITNKKWTGVVAHVERNKANVLQIWIKDCKPMAPSIPPKKETAKAANDAVSFNAKEAKDWRTKIEAMLFEDLEAYYEENKQKLSNWQVTALQIEMAFRKGITGVEQAAQIALNRDHCVIEQRIVKGKFVYVNNDGRVYYETAITVH